jgi:hypothetical protein
LKSFGKSLTPDSGIHVIRVLREHELIVITLCGENPRHVLICDNPVVIAVLRNQKDRRRARYMKLSDSELLARIEREPGLLRLPLVRSGNRLTIDRDESGWKDMLSQAG